MPALIMDEIRTISPKPEAILSHLLEQPTEVVGEVLQWLDLADLLNIRITNRRLHQLIHHHEKSICARFVRRLQRQNAALQLPIKIHGLTNDLLFYIELQRRFSAIQQLSMIFCTHVVHRITIRHPTPENSIELEWRERKVSRLHQRLFPALFLFNNFLECLHSVFMSGEEAFNDWDDEMLLALHDVYDIDQQRIIEDFSPCNEDTIRNVTAASRVLLGVAKSRKLYLTSKSPRYPFASLKRILVSSGLLLIPQLLNPSVQDTDRRDELIHASDYIWKSKGRKPVEYKSPRLRSIHHLETERVQSLGELHPNRSQKGRNWFVERQDIWLKAAFAVVQRQGSIQTFPPDTDVWLRHSMAEAYDPVYDLGDWTTPEPG